MKQTNQSLTEAIKDMARRAIDRSNDPFAVIDVPLLIQVSSDHTEIYMYKGDLHLLITLTGDNTGIHDCKYVGYTLQNPFWVNDLKIADVIADIWAVAYEIDKMMNHQPVLVTV
jgi:hypothetical protein